MNLVLVCIGGEHKGVVWPVTRTPLVLGRSSECAICLGGPTVSRRHCQLYEKDGAVQYEDLGSRNRAIVQGRPLKKKILAPGDDILLGCDHFVLADYADTAPVGAVAPTLLPNTVNWEQVASEHDGVPSGRVRPRTVQDLALLYGAVCEFSGHTTPEALLDAVREQLRRYFDPDALWVCPLRGGHIAGQSSDGAAAEADTGLCAEDGAPTKLIQACLAEKRALLERVGSADGNETLTYAAPVLFDGIVLVTVALRTRGGRDVHPEGGLQFLTLFALSLGPVLYSAGQRAALHEENERLRVRAGQSQTIIGDSAVMRQLRRQTIRAARATINVLVTGETGVGKELVARALHAHSKRTKGLLVVVNCAAIPRELFESELFGHTRGAYTGATTASAGLLLQAHGGTLFLDEIGDLSLDNQARILRVVETRSFRPVGATAETSVDVRIVAATNQDLQAAVAAGRFREDLFHRLNGIHLSVPPLRMHTEDIPALTDYFLSMLQGLEARPMVGFGTGVLEALCAHPWPGNVRELRQTIHRALALAQSDSIELEDVFPPEAPTVGACFEKTPLLPLSDVERRHIEQVLSQCGGNMRKAAKVLGVSRTTLYAKLADYNIRS